MESLAGAGRRIPDRSQQFSPFTAIHQYNPPTNTISAATAPDALVVLAATSPFTPNCRLSGLTQKLLSLSSVLSATVALAIVGDCAGEEAGSTTKTYPCQRT